MYIRNMFEKDINRDISGVIQVGQKDEDKLIQELSEYIVTRELKKHFGTFFDNYSQAIDRPTTEIGVWISGFFGSGKSHFLKILSYLLSNKEVGGKQSIDYFRDKFDDPLFISTIERAVSIPTESILFNIDVEGPSTKDNTAIMRTFAKVFYNHLGYYGSDLKIAELEHHLDQRGKLQAFHEAFERHNGSSWFENRDAVLFLEDEIVATLEEVLGMSSEAARNWYNSEERDFSISSLTDKIKAYADSKGDKFRLLFMVDEVGQYIGEDVSLMLNLQTFVEELGSKCHGKVWVMVTSQEAIDSVVKVVGDDFSKIQGRFNTRLSLTSSSVDEVIVKRILEKNQDSLGLLKLVYDKYQAILKNQFTFDTTVQSVRGFKAAEEFADVFPFVPYQFGLFQDVLVEIRKRDSAGKAFSGGERSMISGFKEAAQDWQNGDENTLVPFYAFYDSIHTYLSFPIRRVIDRAQTAAEEGRGLDKEDVKVLKLLYLLRYVDDLEANIDNMSIMMIDNLDADKIELKERINKSLNNLINENLIARSGEVYSFLTDDEQEISREIQNTHVEDASIIKEISSIIYNDIFPAKRIKYNKYDLPYDQYVDEVANGMTSGGMSLRFVTEAGNLYGLSRENYIMKSSVNQEAIVVLSSESGYFDDLELASKIQAFTRKKNVQTEPEHIQQIIRARNSEANSLRKNARDNIEEAIRNADFYIMGDQPLINKGPARDMLSQVMEYLVEMVYEKIHYIDTFYESDADIERILKTIDFEKGFEGMGVANEEALHDLSQFLQLRGNTNRSTTMGEIQRRYSGIPYGWREVDIAALVARLLAEQKLQIRYGGMVQDRTSPKIVGYLRKRSEVEKTLVERRISPTEYQISNSIRLLKSYTGKMDIPSDEDSLIDYLTGVLEADRRDLDYLLELHYRKNTYPEKKLVEDYINLLDEILKHRSENVAILKILLDKEDELLDYKEDLEDLNNFFKNQVVIYDDARKLVKGFEQDRAFFLNNPELQERLDELEEILKLDRPYHRIKDIPELSSKIKAEKKVLLDKKKEELELRIQDYMSELHNHATEKLMGSKLVSKLGNDFRAMKEKIQEEDSLVSLNGLFTSLARMKEHYIYVINKELVIRGGDPDDIKPIKNVTKSRSEIFPAKTLRSKEDIDSYVEVIREELEKTLEGQDGVELI